jgi:hypothetical protein
MRLSGSWPLAATLALAIGMTQARADPDPCAGFKWDVSKERALFDGAALPVRAGKDAASAAAVEPKHLYRLQLVAADQVSFPVPPGKSTPAEGSYAGVLALSIPAPGHYRIAVDLPLWIDVAADGKLIPAADYEGLHGCSAPRKIVEFILDAKPHLLLQLSAADQALVRLTITQVPVG